MDIIGRVSKPLGDKSFLRAYFPATMVMRLCVFLVASYSFFLLNVATSCFSSSIANNRSLGTPMRTMRSMSSFFIPLSSLFAFISLLSPTTRFGFASAAATPRGFFFGDFNDVFTASELPLARSFFVGTRTKSMTYPLPLSSSSMLNKSSFATRTLAPSGTKNQSSSSSSSSSSQSSSSSIAIGSSSSKSSSFQNNKSSSASAALSYCPLARVASARRGNGIDTRWRRRRTGTARGRAHDVDGGVATRELDSTIRACACGIARIGSAVEDARMCAELRRATLETRNYK